MMAPQVCPVAVGWLLVTCRTAPWSGRAFEAEDQVTVILLEAVPEAGR